MPIPPILLQVGDADRVRDDSLFFYSNSFPNSPIQLEIYQDSVHIFQLFASFDEFSKHALKRLGQFIKMHSGLERVEGTRGASFVCQDEDYNTTLIPDIDVNGIVKDGIEWLVNRKIWKQEVGDDEYKIEISVAK